MTDPDTLVAFAVEHGEDPCPVYVGHSHPQMQVPVFEQRADGVFERVGQESVPARHINQTVTEIGFEQRHLHSPSVEHTLSTDNDMDLAIIARSLPDEHRDFAAAIYMAHCTMRVHSAGERPDWVDCPACPELAEALARHWSCALGTPTNVLCENGRDDLHKQHVTTATQPAAFQYGALSPSASTPELANSTLAEEIVTASGGLIRKKMVFAHSTGTNTSTLIETWTANGSDALPVTIKKFADFRLPKQSEESGKGMAEIDNLNASATLTLSGDSVTVTFTLTAG